SRVRKAFRGSKRVWCKLVKLPKNPMVAGGKIFMRAEGIPMDEHEEVHLVGLRRVVGCKKEVQTGKLFKVGENNKVEQHDGWWEVGITIN
ncbi:hypothetical protein A2U01_0059185, partial [Trifolium medium]|nr:hypothetical protein [Trifolium medium]